MAHLLAIFFCCVIGYAIGGKRTATWAFAGALLAALAACEPHPVALKCVNGTLYQQWDKGEPFKMVDAAPNHSGITPTPCVP